MLSIALIAYKTALKAVRAKPVTLSASLTIMLAACEITRAGGFWIVAGIAAGLASQALALNAVIQTLLGPRSTAPQPLAFVVALTLPTLLALAPAAGVLAASIWLNHNLGPISTWLALPLLLAPASAMLFAAARCLLAVAPASLGLVEPLADSWHITRGRVGFIAGELTIGLGPFAILALLWPSLGPAGFGPWQAACIALLATAASATQGALIATLYERWRTSLRPDMRPSRHRNRRREPQFGQSPPKNTPGERYGFSHPR